MRLEQFLRSTCVRRVHNSIWIRWLAIRQVAARAVAALAILGSGAVDPGVEEQTARLWSGGIRHNKSLELSP
jgi:hypothetical protein